jgi:dTDP-4-dehydrorhamnose 3,5-epimerase
MKFIRTELPGIVVIEPKVFEDPRGFFMETHHADRFREAGLPNEFVQDNHSRSVRNTLRGLHYQLQHPQGKLIRCIRGAVFDVAVDLRQGSPAFGRWFGLLLSEENRRQVYVPPGMAHGFCVLSDTADVIYKCSDFYFPQFERTMMWNDPQIGIQWPISEPLLSEKDRRGVSLAQADTFAPGSV